MPSPIPESLIEHELNYAMALGLVQSFAASRPRGGYRHYIVRTHDDLYHVWTPSAVLAFTTGVRLAVERTER